jgi:hypothetical protein
LNSVLTGCVWPNAAYCIYRNYQRNRLWDGTIVSNLVSLEVYRLAGVPEEYQTRGDSGRKMWGGGNCPQTDTAAKEYLYDFLALVSGQRPDDFDFKHELVYADRRAPVSSGSSMGSGRNEAAIIELAGEKSAQSPIDFGKIRRSGAVWADLEAAIIGHGEGRLSKNVGHSTRCD